MGACGCPAHPAPGLGSGPEWLDSFSAASGISLDPATIGIQVAQSLLQPIVNLLVQKLQSAARCASECAKLHAALSHGKLQAVAGSLGNLVEAMARSASSFDTASRSIHKEVADFREDLEEAYYLVLACTQAKRWNVFRLADLKEQVERAAAALARYSAHEYVTMVASMEQAERSRAGQRSFNRKMLERVALLHSSRARSLQEYLPVNAMKSVSFMPQLPENLVQASIVPELRGGLKTTRALGITGMVGIGKTTIAADIYDREIADGCFERFFFVPVGRAPNTDKILRDVWHKLHPRKCPPGSFGVAHVAAELKREKVLLVLDDVWEAEHLQELNFATPSVELRHRDSRLIVTTRQRQMLNAQEDKYFKREIYIKEVAPLQHDTARALLCAHAFPGTEPPPALSTSISWLVEKCHRVPLELQTHGASLAAQPPSAWTALNKELSRVEKSLKSAGANSAEAMMKRFQPSYDALPPDLQQRFVDFAAFPEDMPVPETELVRLWAALAPVDSSNAEVWAEMQLQQLVTRCLLTKEKDPECADVGVRYSMHGTMRAIAVEEHRKQGCMYAPGQGLTAWPGEVAAPRPSRAWCCLGISQEQGRMMAEELNDAVAAGPVRHVSLINNKLTELPAQLQLPKLRMLCLDGNDLTTLPPSIRAFSRLRVLSLARNTQLTKLPDEMKALLLLRLLNLSGCTALMGLPDLGALSMLRVVDLTGCEALKLQPGAVAALPPGMQLQQDSDGVYVRPGRPEALNSQ